MDSDGFTPAPAGFGPAPAGPAPAGFSPVPAGPVPAGPAPVGASAPVPPAAPPRRFGRRARIAALAVVLVAALGGGVFAWAPWTPNPPTAVHATSPTAGTAVISWTASKGGGSPSHYLVLRDGKQVGSVPASVTSYADHGLIPGTKYHYTVVAAGLSDSGPSVKATVTTATPSPGGLVASQVTHTSVALHWSLPASTPAPDHYVIYNGTNIVTTVPGTTTSYTDNGETAGAQFQYDVVAQWGAAASAPSAAASGQTLAAPLSQSVPVRIETSKTYVVTYGTLTVGLSWNEEWWATPACSQSNCNLTITVYLYEAGGQYSPQFTVGLHPSGDAYTGAATAKVTFCGTPQNPIPETDNVTLTLKPGKGSAPNGAWGSWTGTLMISAPPTTAAGGGCTAGAWTFALTSRN